MAEQEQEFWPGDWVQVWARVETQERTHPEDLRISVDSHNAVPEAVIVVRKDRVVAGEVPDFVGRCTRLAAMGDDGDTLHRCTRHEGHSGNHESPLIDWDEKSTSGYFEEK